MCEQRSFAYNLTCRTLGSGGPLAQSNGCFYDEVCNPFCQRGSAEAVPGVVGLGCELHQFLPE